MPLFDYRCATCDKVWEEFSSIANRKAPESRPGKDCSNTTCKVTQEIAAVPMSYSSDRTIKGGAFKERLQEIHATAAGSQLDKTSTICPI